MANERDLHRADRRVVYGRKPINPVLFRSNRDLPEEAGFSRQSGVIAKRSHVYEGMEGPRNNRATVYTARVIPPQEVVNRDAVWGAKPSMERLVEGIGTMDNPSELFTHYPPEVTEIEQTNALMDDDTFADAARENPQEFIDKAVAGLSGHPALLPKEVKNPHHVWPAPFVRAIQADVLKEWGEHAVHPDNLPESLYKVGSGYNRDIHTIDIERVRKPRDKSDEEFVDFDEELGDVKIPVTSPRHRKENYKLSSQFDNHVDEGTQLKLQGMDG